MSQVIQVSSDPNFACAYVVYVGDCATQLYGDSNKPLQGYQWNATRGKAAQLDCLLFDPLHPCCLYMFAGTMGA